MSPWCRRRLLAATSNFVRIPDIRHAPRGRHARPPWIFTDDAFYLYSYEEPLRQRLRGCPAELVDAIRA
jgi:hypothetical protein